MRHGNHLRAVQSDRDVLAGTARERKADQPSGAERDSVRGGAWLQVARVPKRFGNWHTIYMRMNRWAKNGVLDRVFEQLQLEQIVRIRIEAFSLGLHFGESAS